MQPGITREQIFERDTNLRLGFRYLRWLLKQYRGNREEALHAYNRGPGTVSRIRARGGDPANGYAEMVLGERGASPVGRAAPLDTTAAASATSAHELGPARLPPPPPGM
jgi:soluble lytic murein transglycosylase-like protein